MKVVITILFECIAFPVLLVLACLGRVFPKQKTLGIGPDALISARFHKAAAELCGVGTESFCLTPFYITNKFDVVAAPFSESGERPGKAKQVLGLAQLLISEFTRYECLFQTFNGGVLRHSRWLWRFEPYLLKMAGVKTVILPYGSDVQDMVASKNLLFKHAMSVDYPANRGRRSLVRQRVDLWSKKADHVVAGCDWVDYLHLWDTLTLAHFTIDLDEWEPNCASSGSEDQPVRILHAPNHKEVKGTKWVEKVVAELKSEGVPVELIILESVSNEEVKKQMQLCDVVADQFIVGWYAQFALEGMALKKPVLCYCREDLIDLFEGASLLEAGELPIINCSHKTLKKHIRWLVENRHEMERIGEDGRQFVKHHHSVEAMSKVFQKIFDTIGI